MGAAARAGLLQLVPLPADPEDRAERLRVLLDLAPHLPDLNLDDVDVFISKDEAAILSDLEQEDLDLANACLALEREHVNHPRGDR